MSLTTKIKIILAAVAALIIIVSVICVYAYISKLNKTISDMSVTIAEQKNEIDSLNRNIESLEKNIDSLHNTINITSDYIENLKQIHSDESIVKQAIYEEVMSDPVSGDWYHQELPENILKIIADSNDKLCNEAI